MKVLGVNKLIATIWVVLTTLVFSTLGLTIVAIVDHFEEKQPINQTEQLEVAAWT